MKTLNETYEDFCKLSNLPTNVRVGNLSKWNTKLFLEYLKPMPNTVVRDVIWWVMDEDYRLSDSDISVREKELSDNSEKFLKRKELNKYREISTPPSPFSIPIILW